VCLLSAPVGVSRRLEAGGTAGGCFGTYAAVNRQPPAAAAGKQGHHIFTPCHSLGIIAGLSPALALVDGSHAIDDQTKFWWVGYRHDVGRQHAIS